MYLYSKESMIILIVIIETTELVKKEILSAENMIEVILSRNLKSLIIQLVHQEKLYIISFNLLAQGIIQALDTIGK